jgi:hypothetical protein
VKTRNGLLLFGGIVAVAIAAGVLWARPRGAEGAALAERRHAMEVLGARLAQLRPECPVLVLSNPFVRQAGFLDEMSQFERAGLSGLQRGLGRHTPVTVVFPEIHPEYFRDPQAVVIPPDTRTPLSFLVRAASLDRLAQEHPKCRLVVSLIGLPVGVERLRVWTDEDPRCFALLLPDLRMLGAPENAVEAFRRGKLLAVVARDSASGNPLIVTRDNVEQVLERQPNALGF